MPFGLEKMYIAVGPTCEIPKSLCNSSTRSTNLGFCVRGECGFFLISAAQKESLRSSNKGVERRSISHSLCTFLMALMYFINGFLIDEGNNGAEAIKLSTNPRVEDERGIKAERQI
jgi:hypothetical protein